MERGGGRGGDATVKPDQRAEEKRMLAECIERVNETRAALFQLERFYQRVHECANRHAAVQDLAQTVLDVKAKLFDVSEAAVRGDVLK